MVVTIPRGAAVVVWHAVLVPLFVSLPVALSRAGTRHGWQRGRPGPANLLGAVPIAAGGALVASTVGCHYRAIPEGWKVEARITPGYLLQKGPYAFSRNPMFLGQVTIWAGWAVFTGSLPVVVGLASFVGVWIIGSPFEERGLRNRFGAEYAAYRGRVPRLGHLGSTRGIPPTERRWTRGSGSRTIPDPNPRTSSPVGR